MDTLRDKIKPIVTPYKTKVLLGVVMVLSVIIALILIISFVSVNSKGWINVHLVPHSHDDVGWLRTPEAYYRDFVKTILDNVIYELHRNSIRRFVFVETYFFWRWWQEQSEDVKNVVRFLIRNHQLEIVGGGWCMSDEAVTYYQSFIDQSTWGFRRLNDTFGSITCPMVAWQIDTFGHSKGIASLLAQMGFNGLFFARVDVSDRKYRKFRKLMEFVWTGNENLGESSSIFTSIFYNHYSAPVGFDFENQPCHSEIKFKEFAFYVREVAEYYRTNNILVPMGDDFRFVNAKKYFEKMDLLIRYFGYNRMFKINVIYSTPSLYIDYLRQADLIWPEQKGDFFPYSSETWAYWTGYYTSRPSLKYFERITNNIMQITKQLLVFSNTGMKFFDELTTLREAVGVVQHHDAITGTAQQRVTDHYVKLLHEGIEKCRRPIDEALGRLSDARREFPRPMYKSCLLLNISVCDVSERSARFVVTVYNPLSRVVSHYVRVPVIGEHYSVRGADGKELITQILALPKTVRSIPGRMTTAKAELIFKAENVPGMGFKSFFVSKEKSRRNGRRNSEERSEKNFELIFDPSTQLLHRITSGTGNFSLSQSIKFYKSTPHFSGAYLFKPTDNDPVPLKKVSSYLLSDGEIVTEYEQQFSFWASQILRLYKGEDYLEVEWLVGPIPVEDYVGKEVVLLYSSEIESGKNFYTDVNGMEMEKRARSHRSLREKAVENVGGNYYPVTSMISIKDESSQMNVIVDRPQGGTSLHSGEIELMVHRRLCYDDGKGVEEPLNETAYGVGLVARGRHWVLFGERHESMDQKAKLFAQMKHSEPWLFFLDASSLTFEEWSSRFVAEFSGLYSYVPRNVRVLTLEPWREDTVLLRLEHVFEKLSVSRLTNAPVLISLKNFFKNFDVLEARETTLGADRWLSDSKRLKWRKLQTRVVPEEKKEDFFFRENMTISLRPQEIRTFILRIKLKD